jgi:hypothetical protein
MPVVVGCWTLIVTGPIFGEQVRSGTAVIDLIEPRVETAVDVENLSTMLDAKKSLRECIGKLAIRIMFPYEVIKPRKAVLMQPRHIRFAETFAILPEVWTSPELFDHLFSSRVIFFKAECLA